MTDSEWIDRLIRADAACRSYLRTFTPAEVYACECAAVSREWKSRLCAACAAAETPFPVEIPTTRV